MIFPIALTAFLTLTGQPASPKVVPGWVEHGNRTVYAINVPQCTSQTQPEAQLKALEDQLPYLESTGAGAFVLTGLPSFASLSDPERARLQRIVNSFHDQGDFVISGSGLDDASKNKINFDGELVGSGPDLRVSFLAETITHSAANSWPISSLSSDEWRQFLLPDLDKNPVWPAQTLQKNGWMQSSPTEGPRLYSTLKGNIDTLKQALVYLFTTRKTPEVLFGDEVGLGNAQGLMPWDQSQQNLVILNFVQTLAQLRMKRESLSQGDIQLLKINGADGVIAIQRSFRFESTIVVWNTQNQTMNFNLPVNGFANQRVKSYLDGSDEGTPMFNMALTLPAHGVMILGTVGANGQ